MPFEFLEREALRLVRPFLHPVASTPIPTLPPSRGKGLRIAIVAFRLGRLHAAEMHAPPPANELEFLIGLEIGQVCLDPWSIQFMFSEGGHIAVEGPLEHVDPDGNVHRHQEANEQDRGPVFLRELIQRRITRIAVDGFGLSLFVEDGAILRFFTDTGPYECVQIYHPDGRPMPLVF